MPVPHQDAPAMDSVHSRKEKGGQHHKASGQAGGNEVQDIIQFCRRPSKKHVCFILIPYHGVHGVNCLIEHPPGRSEQGHEKERGHHPVRCILRHGLNGGPGNAGWIKHRRIPSHNHGHLVPGPLHVPGLQAAAYLHALRAQASGRKHLVTEDGLHGKGDDPKGWTGHLPQYTQYGPGNQEPHRAHDGREEKTGRQFPGFQPFPQAAFQP